MKSVVSDLLPQNTPLQLMIEHGDILEELSSILEDLVIEYFEHRDIADLVSFISHKESAADTIKFNLRKILDNPRIKVPFPKPTLLYAMHVQDDIIDMIEDIAKRMSMNYVDFVLEPEVQQHFISLVRETRKIIDYLEEAIRELKYVMASSFSKRERKKEEKEIIKIEELESQIDRLTQKLGKWAFSKKHEFNPLDIIFFNELVIIFSQIADKAENLAELLRSFTH